MSDVQITQVDRVLELRLDRPKKKNALSFAMYLELAAALDGARANPAVRAVLLSSSGDVFCAGNDIQDFMANPAFEPSNAPPIKFIEALVAFDKPLLVAVHGAAVGIGTTMLLHADLVYASAAARFSVPFVGLGLVPEAASSLLLPRRVGHAVANDMLLRNVAIDAERALALGLVNELAAGADEVLTLARARASEVAAQPPAALRMTKALAREDSRAVLARVHEEAKLFASRVGSDEAREAFTAFFERRPADFSKFT